MKKILLIGAGPIVIGQACEFDYSGVQACNILKDEGYKVYLINNNPATVMTDSEISHKVFFKNVNFKNIVKILNKYKINKILPNVGGQTGINSVIELNKKNIIKKNNIKILGASIDSIINSEDRNVFRNKMIKNNISIPMSGRATNLKEALNLRKNIINKSKKKEIIMRTSYTLGGFGGGKVAEKKEFIYLFKKSFKITKNPVLIEESLFGNKEIELEVLVDKKYNFVIVCGIENLDELGVHTGDSSVISPIQTLNNKEIQNLRKITKLVLKALKINSCGINIQFSYNKKTGDINVIEVNPRVSRSSALASKATGYPIAKVSTLLSIGKNIGKIKKIIFNKLPAFYEPSMDYLVMKIPKFSNKKFNFFEKKIGMQMKSVGESMSISSNNEDLFQKSFRSLEQENLGLHMYNIDIKNIIKKSSFPNESRILSIYELFTLGLKVKNFIDPFFLNIIKKISVICNFIRKIRVNFFINKKIISFIKNKGFSDNLISLIIRKKKNFVLKKRIRYNIYGKYKVISSCSSETRINSNFIYSSYFGKNEITSYKKTKYLVLGSGPNKVGQGIEFDYCCVHALKSISRLNFFSIIINNNPETVSTDHDNSNRLFFLPCDFEEIFNIYGFEKFKGLFLQFCGQISLKLAKKIKFFKIPIIGTNIDNIIKSENRDLFNKIVKRTGFKSPKYYVLKNTRDNKIKNYPLLLRPSFVLGGENMKTLKKKNDFKAYLKENKKNLKYLLPITLDVYIKDCVEYDIDFIVLNKRIHILPIIQQVEKLGIHSGDSSGFIVKKKKIKKKIISFIKKIIKDINIKGFSNIQIGIKKKKIYIIELNPRASRTIPFIIKSIGFDYVKFCVLSLLKNKFVNYSELKKKEKRFYNKKIFSFKTPIFSFNKFPDLKAKLGPDMKSTGESITLGKNKYKTYLESKFDFSYIKKIKYLFFITKKSLKIKILKILNNKKVYFIGKKNLFFMINKINFDKKINCNNALLFSKNNFMNFIFCKNVVKDIRIINCDIFNILLKGLKKI